MPDSDQILDKYTQLKLDLKLQEEEKQRKIQEELDAKNPLKQYEKIQRELAESKEKYSKEIYELSEYILIILISLNKIEIDNVAAKNNISSKIIYTRKLTTISFGKLSEIINNIINNLKLVEQFIKLFNQYLEKLNKKNTKDNIHNNTFELAAKYKKENILLEYNKYCDKFTKVIDYFKECSDAVIDQIETSKLLKFFLKLKE